MIWIKEKLSELKSSEYVRNVATLASGTTIAQFISVGTAPILYRIYSKEDYGTLGTYMAIVGVIGVFSTLRYNEAILLEEDDQNAKKVLWLNRYINILFTLTTIIIVLIGSGLISNYLNNPELNKWLYLIPVSVFFSGQNEIFKIWANRKKEYKLLTLNSILNAVLVPIVSISLGIFINSALGLFIGLILSQIIPSVLLYLKMNDKYLLDKDESINYISLKEFVKKYKNFPFYSLPADFINRLTTELPVFIISSFYGASIVGIYNLCTRMLGLPIQLISSSISTIFREKAIKDYFEFGNCLNIFKKTVFSLLLFSLLPLTIVLLFGPYLFSFVFGVKWYDAGVFAQILSPMYFFNFLVSPLTYTYYIAQKQKEDLVLHVLFLIGTALVFYLAKDITINQLLINYSLLFCILYLVYFFRSLKFANGSN